MTINFQELLKVCEATEKLPLGRFDMSLVVNECGTVGCMIGNYNAMVGRTAGRFAKYEFNKSMFFARDVENGDWLYFGISEKEYLWLFANRPDGTNNRYATAWGGSYAIQQVTRDQALRRLRKFIYFKLHKHEMTYDEKYGVRQEARHAEGNHNFAQRAKSEALALETV